jgi:2-polyprenyl-6-methoxyphenol hydroxylase-like FAD-dependent oxidoreductase
MRSDERGGATMEESKAVVIGAGMGGLLAAAALAERFQRVTVLERDELPEEIAPRRAVPQGSHAHALLPMGHQCLETLLPGITADLIGAGALPYRALVQLRMSLGGHQLARGDAGRDSIVASRPLFETVVRRRVAALEGVEIRAGWEALGLLAGPTGERVTGVRALRRAASSAEEALHADLVVVATGRGGRLPAWLEGLDYPRPAEERIDVDFVYASRHLALAPGALGTDRMVLIGARPGVPRTLALFAQEHGRWLLTLGGYGGNHPPREEEAFLDFADTVAPPDVAAAIRAATPLDEIVSHRFPANLRRRYGRLPEGLLPIGDALCAFNPIYGQGMTVAALEAVALRDALAAGEAGMATRYLASAGRIVDQAWQLAAGADLAQPAVGGPRPPKVRIVNAYLRRLLAAAQHDGELAVAFIRVSGMMDPAEALLAPAVLRRVARAARAARATRRAAPPAPASARPPDRAPIARRISRASGAVGRGSDL